MKTFGEASQLAASLACASLRSSCCARSCFLLQIVMLWQPCNGWDKITPENAPKAILVGLRTINRGRAHAQHRFDLTALAFRRSGWTANPSLTSRVPSLHGTEVFGFRICQVFCRFCHPFGKRGPSEDTSPVLKSYAERCSACSSLLEES